MICEYHVNAGLTHSKRVMDCVFEDWEQLVVRERRWIEVNRSGPKRKQLVQVRWYHSPWILLWSYVCSRINEKQWWSQLNLFQDAIVSISHAYFISSLKIVLRICNDPMHTNANCTWPSTLSPSILEEDTDASPNALYMNELQTPNPRCSLCYTKKCVTEKSSKNSV